MKALCIGNGQTNQTTGEITGALNCMHDQQSVAVFGGAMDNLKFKLTACIGGGETAQTLDASYYKGTGSRNGKEREILAGEQEPVYLSDRKGHNGITEDGTATTLTAQEKERPAVSSSIVRRLTPTECMRLQGYPDGWLEIGEPKELEVKREGETRKETRYYWTDENGKLREEADSAKYKAAGNSIALPFWSWLWRRIAAQYERHPTMGSLFDGIGGFPLTAIQNGVKPLWASEIEPFPIAVCKKHFGDEDAGIEGDIWKYL